MSWERDPLWAKSRLYFERAFNESRDDPAFGLWCSFGLELLARAALASVSPTLLAENDHERKNLLYALNRGSELTPRKSIFATQVFDLCRILFPGFSKEDSKAAIALISRRNEELHSGAAAFDEYRPSQWLAGFYRACQSLATAMGESLDSLFGEDEAKVATDILAEIQNDVKQHVLKSIASCRKAFLEMPGEEQIATKKKAEELGSQLATQRHHRGTCPACQCIATCQGAPVGKEHISHGDGDIVVRQDISPTSFSCSACGLKLHGYAELHAASLGGCYTRRTTFSPEEYYGLIDPDNPENLEPYIEDYLANQANREEYDNE